MIIRDVKHRWNYTEAMISRALVLRKAIQRWVLERDELHLLVLSDDHWKLLEALREILKVRATAPFVSLLTSFSDSF
ncbi:hypothetical protein B0H14DRAFT_2362731 [Mycena olivaceomarginata]|nr:hypothetical protein B0H14DRAFT_2362731 [Mycena olivaceomarginata]